MGRGRRKNVSAKRHLELAGLNETAYAAIRKGAYPAAHWAGTALFYAALHYADAILRHEGDREPSSHEERWRLLTPRVDNEYVEHYLALKDLSEDWRYYGVETQPHQLDLAYVGHFKPLATATTARVS